MPDSDPLLPSMMSSLDERLYRICLFDPGAVVPRVQLVSASDDEHVIALAAGIDPMLEREVWDRHRLVVQIPAIRPMSVRDVEPAGLG